MAVPLDKIKFQRPINFKEISVAKWRDPTRSALPYQGVTTPGPEPAFMPTYRRILKISGPEAGLETESEDEPPGGAAPFAPAEHTQEEPELPAVDIIDVPANDAVVLDISPPGDDSNDIVIVLGDEPDPALSLDDPAFAQLSDSGEKRVGFAPDTVDPVPGKKKKKKAGKKKKGDLDLPGPPDFVRVMEGDVGDGGVVDVTPGEVVVVVGEGDGNAGAGEGAGVFDVVPVPEIVAVVEDPEDVNAEPEAMAVVVDGQREDRPPEEDVVIVVGGSEDVDVAQDPEAGGTEAIVQAVDVAPAPPLGVDAVEVLPPDVLTEEGPAPLPTPPAQFEELPSLPGGFPPADLVDLAPPLDDDTAGAAIVLIDDAEAEPKPKKKKKKSKKKAEDLPVLDLSIGEDAAVVDGMADGPPDSAVVIIGDQAGPDAAVVVMDSAPAEEIALPEEGNAEGDVVVVFEAVTLPPGDVEDVALPEVLPPVAVSDEIKEETPGEGTLPPAVVAHDTEAHELIPASEPAVVVEVSPVEAPEATGLPPYIVEDTGLDPQPDDAGADEAVAVPEDPPLDLPPPVDLLLPPPSDPLHPPEPPIPAPPPAAVPDAPPQDLAPNSTIEPPAPDPLAIPSPPPDPPLSASTTSDSPLAARPTHRRHRSSTSHRADHWTRPARKRRESDVSATSTRPSASASATSNTKPTPISTSTSDHRSRRHSNSATNAFSRDEAERRERRRAERAEDERRAREAAEAAEREEEERRARRAARREARKTAEAAAERERVALAAAQAAEDEERRRRRRERRRGGEGERGVGSERVRRRSDGGGGGGSAAGEKRPSLLKAFTIQGESVRMRESEVLRERPRVRRVESERSRRDEGRRGSRVVREEPRTILGALRRAFLPL